MKPYRPNERDSFQGQEYEPEPKFTVVRAGEGVWDVFVEHVEFIIGFGEPITRVWARSTVGRVRGDKKDLDRAITREAMRRGYI